jgi:murein DD-endopeptidase MepM/ murein hydrolase activator NlpD
MKRKNVGKYLANKKYYLSLLGCLLLTLLVVGVIYRNDRPYEEIANLNKTVEDEDLVENPVTEEVEEENIPRITIHDEVIEAENAFAENPTQSGEGSQETEMVLEEVELIPDVVEEEVIPVIQTLEPVFTFDENEVLLMPALGTILLDYDAENPVFFKTLDQYKVNKGLMIGADKGTEVKAATDGVVEEISTDQDYGNRITIYHGNGFKTTYSQLEKDMNVKEGEAVERGETNGYIDTPTMYYSEEGSHVFFELRKDDHTVNPHDYME